MVRHWMAERRKGEHAFPGWRRATVINAIGALTTLVVLIVVTISKALDGAWLDPDHGRHGAGVPRDPSPLPRGAEEPAHAAEASETGARTRDAPSPRSRRRDRRGTRLRPRDATLGDDRPASGHANEDAHADLSSGGEGWAGDAIPLEVRRGPNRRADRARASEVNGASTARGQTVVIPELVSAGSLPPQAMGRVPAEAPSAPRDRRRDHRCTGAGRRGGSEPTSEVDPPTDRHARVRLLHERCDDPSAVRDVPGAAETRAIFFQLDPEDTSGIQEAWFNARPWRSPWTSSRRRSATYHGRSWRRSAIHGPARYGRERRDPGVGPTATLAPTPPQPDRPVREAAACFEERAILTSVPCAPGKVGVAATRRRARGPPGGRQWARPGPGGPTPGRDRPAARAAHRLTGWFERHPRREARREPASFPHGNPIGASPVGPARGLSCSAARRVRWASAEEEERRGRRSSWASKGGFS